ncbi:ComEA family DNA-binding protein [Paenibacillus lentus]|uniref:ComEA family DNA-binding protein n=1 Tax=Paenibacillus lentus TaxID=1338368 RepID=UPI0036D3D8C1
MPPTVRAPLDGKIIDINTASEAQIASIPEIGIVLAKRVVIKRQELGGFRSFEQFSQVMGLKEHTMRSIAQIVVFSQATSNNITQPKSGRIIDY